MFIVAGVRRSSWFSVLLVVVIFSGVELPTTVALAAGIFWYFAVIDKIFYIYRFKMGLNLFILI